MNGLFKVSLNDVMKGIIVAVISAIIIAIGGVVMTPNFNAFATDWLVVGQNMINIGIISMVSYLIKQLLTTNDGVVLGADLG